MSQTRRVLIASALALAAAPALAADKKSVEVGKAFPYLENFWKLPAGERSRFTVVYYLKRDGRPAAGLRGAIVLGATRIPVSVGATGRVSPLPTLAQIRGGAKLEFDVPADTRFSMGMQIEPTARPAAEMSAPDLALAVTQAAKGAKKVAGLMGMAMPTIAAVAFKGVSAGTVVHADGRTAALPVKEGMPFFQPGKLRTAATLKFARAPSQLLLSPVEG
jgi:hypothetical protein